MRILSIETSCDETAIAVVDAVGDETSARFRVRGNALQSQIHIHREYGGVFPALAKREHARNLVPVLQKALTDAGLSTLEEQTINESHLQNILYREHELASMLIPFLKTIKRPDIDTIAVTSGPGLEPALWVGVNFAHALNAAWDIPIVPINHMEGHILSALAEEKSGELHIQNVSLPVLALLISGGHTELVLMKEWLSYELVGQTQDDAVGEAFDKVARMMNLPYPGGPEISKAAEKKRQEHTPSQTTLPRPMLHTPTCDFSFSGLKTAVLYSLKDKELTDSLQEDVALEFENAVGDVLLAKTTRAVDTYGARTIVLGGGVSANTHIRRVFKTTFESTYPDLSLRIPHASLTTDNAVMIALAGFYRAQRHQFSSQIVADGNATVHGH